MSWAAVIVGVAGFAGAAMSADSAKDASGKQVGASRDAISAQQQALAQQRSALSPYSATGTAANQKLSMLLGIGGNPGGQTNIADWKDPVYARYVAGGGYTGAAGQTDSAADQAARQKIYDQVSLGVDSTDSTYGALTKPITMADVAADPSYSNGLQFGLDTGMKGINQAALAGGTYDSGATLKALTQFGNDYGTTKTQGAINNIFSNRGQQYGFLSGQQGVGMNAASGTNLATSNTANNVGQLTTGIGNSQAAALIGGANAYSGIGSNIANAYSNQNAANNQSSILQKILGYNQQPTYSGGTTSYNTASAPD